MGEILAYARSRCFRQMQSVINRDIENELYRAISRSLLSDLLFNALFSIIPDKIFVGKSLKVRHFSPIGMANIYIFLTLTVCIQTE